MDTAEVAADPIPAFIRRVEEIARTTALTLEEAEAVVSAGLDDNQVQAVITTVMNSPLTLTQAIGMVQAAQPKPDAQTMYRYAKVSVREKEPARPAYTSSLLENFRGVKARKRAWRPVPRKQAKA